MQKFSQFFAMALFLLITFFSWIPNKVVAQIDGDYTLQISRRWADDHAPNKSNQYYFPGKIEGLYTIKFQIANSLPVNVKITDRTNSGFDALKDLRIKVETGPTVNLTISGTINKDFNQIGTARFRANYLVEKGKVTIKGVASDGMRPNYFPELNLTFLPSNSPSVSRSASTQSSSAPTERIRTAQTILSEMGLYRSSIDGVLGPGTRRALQDAMRQYGSSAEPTVENFIAETAKRRQAASPTVSVERISQDLRVCEASKLSVGTRLLDCDSKLAASESLARSLASDNEQLRSAASVESKTKPESELVSLVVSQQLEIEALKKQLATPQAAASGNAPQESRGNETELRAELDETKRKLEAANKTIVSMQESSVPVATHREVEQQRDALSKALAAAKEATEANFIAREEHVAALAAMQDTELNLRRQLDGVNKSLVDLQDNISRNYVSLDEHKLKIATLAEAEASLRRQLDAANTTVADLQNKIEIGYVPLASHKETLAQLDALNARIVDLQNTMERDYTPNAKMVEALRLIDAANSTIADLQASIAAEYKPLLDFQQLERQISALNTTILELQERNEVQRNRMLESEALFRNFRDDCAASADCKKAMRLE